MTSLTSCAIFVVPRFGLYFFARYFKRSTGVAERLNRGRLDYRNNLGGAFMRVKVTLACTECKQRNYNTMKNKKNTPDRLEMNKYCRFCKKHTVHRETK